MPLVTGPGENAHKTPPSILVRPAGMERNKQVFDPILNQGQKKKKRLFNFKVVSLHLPQSDHRSFSFLPKVHCTQGIKKKRRAVLFHQFGISGRGVSNAK